MRQFCALKIFLGLYIFCSCMFEMDIAVYLTYIMYNNIIEFVAYGVDLFPLLLCFLCQLGLYFLEFPFIHYVHFFFLFVLLFMANLATTKKN